MSFPISTTPGIYRLVSTALATGVTYNAASNDNITFVTNIPSLDFAIRIWRTRLTHSTSAGPIMASTTTNTVQLFGQLTENQTKTSVLVNDSSYLDQFFVQPTIAAKQDTAVGDAVGSLNFQEIIHDFNPVTTPWTVATKLNWVVSSIAAAGWVSGTWKPLVIIEYTMERLTADLRDYLAKRLQIQGS